MTARHDNAGGAWLRLAALCIVAAVGCDQQLEVLTLASDSARGGGGSSSGEVCAGGCEGDTVCSGGRCIGPPALALVATGSRHSCQVQDGELSCWGDNRVGQLGIGDQVSRASPVRVGMERDWMTVTAGANHTCGLRGQGAIYCWGDNGQGQLGNGTASGVRTRPRSVGAWSDVVDLRCGAYNCCALRRNAGLYCWGANLDGSAGIGGTGMTPVTEPTRVAPVSSFSSAFSVGWGHSCAIRRDRSLFCWGSNSDGQLGQGETRAASNIPAQVLEDKDWLRVAAGLQYTCGVRRGGELSCWGANEAGQLGIASNALDGTSIAADIPNPVGVTGGWSEIAAGGAHTCGLKFSGELHCWGRGNVGQLGIGGEAGARAPTLVAGAMRWTSVAVGAEHTCASDLEHEVYCWGRNAAGQLGLGDMLNRDEPTAVLAPEAP